MKFRLDTPIPDYTPKINHGDALLFIGSCFSDEMAGRFRQAGFRVLSNPFGTIFHPLPLARILENVLEEKEDFHLFEDKNNWFSWNASTLLSAKSKQELQDNFRRIQLNLRESIQNSTYFFITFGTAWAYALQDGQLVVANCHKQPAARFDKNLSEVETMVAAWEKIVGLLRRLNPQLQMVFTVSPVRHVRDGLVENNRSKARLFETITRLESRIGSAYFPSYEIVTDELRDYRFYKEDLVHPSDQAIAYIWEKVQHGFCSPETRVLIAEVQKLRLLEQHRPMGTNETETWRFETEREVKINAFRVRHPEIYW